MKFLFGIPEKFTLINSDPRLKYRFKFRNNDFAYVYVKSKNGIECFSLEDLGNSLVRLAYKQGENRRV